MTNPLEKYNPWDIDKIRLRREVLRKVYGEKREYTYSEDDLFPSAAHYYLCYDEKTGKIFRRPNEYECPDGFVYIGKTPSRFAALKRILND